VCPLQPRPVGHPLPLNSPETDVQLKLKSPSFTENPLLVPQVERRARLEFGRYGGRVDRVTISVLDRTEAAPIRFHCGVGVHVLDENNDLRLVVSMGEDNDLYRSVDSALTRAGVRTGGEIARAEEALRARRQWLAGLQAHAGTELSS